MAAANIPWHITVHHRIKLESRTIRVMDSAKSKFLKLTSKQQIMEFLTTDYQNFWHFLTKSVE
ncbi:hypothetical protein KIN20_005189 [Parelaphostrongylus tenuis]|uniref:Uncharacterized protein n=1 Tax=Parelaphostrongylus tenuis TaxID=148309 RepID=A0AAD5MII1_PARTN|nr:hypothetical protein KIN20_005189 [Parelaphostrongylus tenuis]